MSQMKDACNKVLNSVVNALACGVIDLERKIVVEMAHLPQFSAKQQEITTQSIMNLFRGQNAKKLSVMVHAQLGKSTSKEKDFKEIQMATQKNFYFSKAIKSGNAALILVTKENTNIGMAWVQLKSIISIIEPLIP